MKILAIIGSPRKKGNSYQATREVEKQIKQFNSEAKFEYLFLQETNLKMCLGCFNCVRRGEDFCPLQDDRAEIEEKIMSVDGVIFVSPVYCQNVSGLMKNFIDRFSYVFHRPRFFKQRAMAISSTGGAGLDETLDYIKKLSVWGFGELGTLGVITPPWPPSKGLQKKNTEKIEKASLEFYKKLVKGGLLKPTFTQYMHFRFMKFTSEMKEYMPADHEFYKEKEEYFYPTKINPLRKYFVSVMMKLILFFMTDLEPAKI